eukprot:gnl/Spiro4/9938_TR5272_c0_g1_i1.p2 gnl/Spiro4/9938_TR5272_c0_g1~~gnl/Spiro4/9938_TR5272_c0_g1_i1.p2  ORF type:complete len:150 (+),score=21.66 gnl/Spiro4/9938_TR5272_c0_g1_i1:46-495(+)
MYIPGPEIEELDLIPDDVHGAFTAALVDDRADVVEQYIRKYPALAIEHAGSYACDAAGEGACGDYFGAFGDDAAIGDGFTYRGGWITLNVAAYFGSERCIAVLLRNGADPSRTSRMGKTAEEVARGRDKHGAAELLRAHAAAKAGRQNT